MILIASLLILLFTFIIMQKTEVQALRNVSTKFNRTQNEIRIFNIQTQPSVVTVNTTFKIHAIIINNSSKTITFRTGCFSPLSAKFDSNVIVMENNISCFAIRKTPLNPGNSMIVVGPGSAISYKAYSAGLTKATVSFSYNNIQQNNELDNTSSGRTSKSFLFTIYPNH